MYFLACAKNFSSAVVISNGTGLSFKWLPCSVLISSEDELENGHQAFAAWASKTDTNEQTSKIRCMYIVKTLKI